MSNTVKKKKDTLSHISLAEWRGFTCDSAKYTLKLPIKPKPEGGDQSMPEVCISETKAKMFHPVIISESLKKEQGLLIISFPINLPSQFGIILFSINLLCQPKLWGHFFPFPRVQYYGRNFFDSVLKINHDNRRHDS